MPRNELLAEVREFIRQPAAWPGGYPKILIMRDSGTICAECAKHEYRQISNETRHNLPGGWCASAVSVHWEGAPICCDHCGKETESAYGENEE